MVIYVYVYTTKFDVSKKQDSEVSYEKHKLSINEKFNVESFDASFFHGSNNNKYNWVQKRSILMLH